jgi:tryptophan synthase alpha chain
MHERPTVGAAPSENEGDGGQTPPLRGEQWSRRTVEQLKGRDKPCRYILASDPRRVRAGEKCGFIPFTVLGYPDERMSIEIIRAMVRGGADMVELGFPFSDPIADGPVIQEADTVALRNGADTESCFRMLRMVRGFTDIPIGLLLYYNLIYQYGVEAFYGKCRALRIQYVLAADVPLEEAGEIVRAAKKNGVGTVFIVSEVTDEERLRRVVAQTTGFLYVVTRLGVTGARESIHDSTTKLLQRLRPLTKLPLYAGFGISKPEHVRAVCGAGADGAICGSAIIRLVAKSAGNKHGMLKNVESFVREMKAATT